MPEDRPNNLVSQTPVITGRTIEIQKEFGTPMDSPMMSPAARRDQIKNQALQTLKVKYRFFS
jgi:hypothetical protein